MFLLGVSPDSPKTLREVLRELCDSATDMEIVVPADGSCARTGCDAPATRQTLIGIPFCDQHFSEFYTA